MNQSRFLLPLLCLCFTASCGAADAPAAPQTPTSADPSVKVTLLAAEPAIVTPIGATVDARGRLFVVESNTHFRQKNYKGPESDRILIFQDSKEAGKTDQVTIFFEGMKYLMNIAADKDGSVVVSSRNEIFRLADDGHGAAGPKVSIAHLETKSDYPHNGLHGLTLDAAGNIYFSIGENLGGRWTLVGADGKKLSDDTGSGAIFKTDSKGNGLTRVARGFWNPFGLGISPLGTLWAVDNDPDGRPPCRLIDVLPGADYGYEFRYGRTGMHPLQAWDAELPGTLGMVAGVGEAPCAVQWNRGKFFVSSWRDHQVQAYTLVPHGASYTATMQPLLHGGENFRPVGLAFAPDGTLYVTDWASASYSVNGKGRIWKVTFGSPAPKQPVLKLSPALERAAHLRQSDSIPELTEALDDIDPATAQAAQYGLSRLAGSEKIDWNSLKTPRQHIGLLASLLWRGASAEAYIPAALKDPDDRVRQMGVRAITEQGIKSARADLDQLLQSQVLSPRLLGMTMAAINLLDGDRNAKIDSGKISAVLLARMNVPQATDQSKAAALRMLQMGHPHIAMDKIAAMLQAPVAAALQLEAVRYLNADADPARFALLAQTASDAKVDSGVRAEAVLGLSDDATAHVALLLKFAADPDAVIRHEALRSLRPAGSSLTAPQKETLAHIAEKYPADQQLVDRVNAKVVQNRPAETDIAAYQKIIDEAPGDPQAGLRIFFHPAGPGCFHCHVVEGRGRVIGPDLSMIGHSQTSQHVLESILDPSREIAPLFTMWSITKRSGERIDAMLLRRDGQGMEVYTDATGVEIKVPEKEIVDRKIRKESLMPNGLVQGMTDQELRDVTAMLLQKR
ncbi:MAG TPA: PVC-type heme-binding CxxCH protein [Humisphaera sp.]|nr:PVC-type heme-binding CxxCH protein [Humisphaera sp.]